MSDPKLTKVGTCIVCQREIAVRTEAETGVVVLVHHGYRRPGNGAIHGDCFAVGMSAHELSPVTARYYQKQCELDLASYLDFFKRLTANDVATLQRLERLPVPTTQGRPSLFGDPRNDPGWREELVTYRRDDEDPERQIVFQRLRSAATVETKQRAEWSESEIRRMQKAIETWRLQDLRDRPKVEPSTKPRRRRMRWAR